MRASAGQQRPRCRQRGFLGLSGLALYAVIGLSVALALSWAASGAAFWWLDGKLGEANERATQAAAARAAEEQSRLGFQAAASTCGASVKALAASGDRRDALWAKQLGASAAKTEAAEGKAAEILSRQRPAGQTECDAIKDELNAEIDRRALRR